MPNLVMVMPYQAFIAKAQAEGFRISAIWDPAVARRLYGDQAAAYLAEVEARADGFRLTDFTDPAGYAQAIRTACHELDADHVWHVGGEDSMMLAYRVADELGLAVNPPEAVGLLNDKLAMRTLLHERGISSVRFTVASRWQDVAGLLDGFDLPVVVKPATLAGSRGTYLLTDPADLPAWGRTLEGYGYDGPLLVEEYLCGPEYSVETLTVDGAHHVVGVTRKLLGPLPHFVEMGHLFPEPDAVRARAVADLAVALLDAAGYRCGPAHTEVIVTDRGPRIVESQARLGGDRIPRLVELATGFDLERGLFAALAGRAPGELAARAAGHIAYLDLPAGVLTDVRGLDAARRLAGVDLLSFPFTPGDVVPRIVNSKTRHGFVVVAGADAAQALSRAALVRSTVEVDVGQPAGHLAGRPAGLAVAG